MSFERFWATTFRWWFAPSRDQVGIERHYSSDLESFETIVRDLANDDELFQAAKSMMDDGAFDLDGVRGACR